MDPFGNFGWDFGFGFGWILIGVFGFLLVMAIAQLARFSFKDRRTKSQRQAELNSLKEKICAGKITLEELEEKIRDTASS